jgi:perosamine synthetase
MTKAVAKVYCGPAVLRLRNIVSIKKRRTFDSYFEKNKVVYVHRGRTAIRLACDLLDVGANSMILAPSYNCGSEIDALMSSGASVILYKIDKTASIDIKDLERKITNRTKAVYVTHYFGFPHSLENIKKLCKENNLYLIEDCALALFSWHNNRMVGTTGDIAIFSLPKTLPVPDGGILLISKNVAEGKAFSLSEPERLEIFIATIPWVKAALMRRVSLNRALNRLSKICANIKKSDCRDNDRISSQERNDMPEGYYYIDQYSNKDMSSFTRRIIKTFEPNEIKEKRRRNYKLLDAMLEGNPDMAPLYKELPDEVCPLYFPLFVEERDAMVEKLNQQQIDARAWWRGFHKSLPWSEFPDACYLKDKIVALPVHQDLSETAFEYMAKCIKKCSRK